MADIIDDAQQQVDIFINDAIYRASHQKQLPLTGKCHYCEDDAPGAHFCGKDCAQDWEYEQTIRRKQGLA